MKAKRQQQKGLSVRKRSDSNKRVYLCESEATATKGFIKATTTTTTSSWP
ncbi:hypothetical protein ACFVT8_15050 [Lysinibacillus sp. NPDC058147]